VLDTDNRVAMITGANRGIGLAIATALDNDGWSLSLGGRDRDDLVSATGHLGKNQRVSRHRYDTHDRTTDRAWVDATLTEHGRIDALVNNAGVAHLEGIEALNDASLDEMWEVNAKAPLRLIQMALPQLRVSGTGRIINIVSLSGKRVAGTFAPGYAMTKHAALAMSHAVRHAVHADGIRVTAVCPSFVATDMTATIGPEPTSMIQAEDLAETVALVLRLPNTAGVAELIMTCIPEAGA
jgi:NADP-dependent 3-hydroxy acid dehydrogenase YdfG